MQHNFLLMDRNKRFLSYMEDYLESNYKNSMVYHCCNVDEAMEVIKQDNIDIMLCEDQMDQSIKFQHFSHFMNLNPGIQIISTTSYDTPEFVASSICHGALDTLVKPISLSSFESMLKYAFEVLEIFNKKSLLLQDIIMLSTEGQMYSPSTVKPLIFSLENRFSMLKGRTPFMLRVLKNIIKPFNLSSDDNTLMELSLAFYGVSFDLDKLSKSVKSIPSKKIGGSSTINLKNLSKSLLIIKNSYNWYNTISSEQKSSNVDLMSRIIAVIVAFISLTANKIHRLSFCIDTAIATIKRYSGTRFDPEVVKALIKCKENLIDNNKEN